jgi:RNA polymerase sigma-70 factor (ECF subfamily)
VASQLELTSWPRPVGAAAIDPRQGACVAQSVHELTSAIASGNAEAFARLYRAWFDHCLAEARRCTGRDEQFCLDAVQEAMLRVIRHMRPLQNEAALGAWLSSVVRTACIDLLRRDLRRRRREVIRTEQTSHGTSSSSTAPAGIDDALDRIHWLRHQLANLPADQARLLDLRFRMGWTLARIGRALRMNTGAVDGRINRTLNRLRAEAPEDFHE